jgi:hypothetical protein
MTLKQVMLPIAMALSTIVTAVLDSFAYAGPRSLSRASAVSGRWGLIRRPSFEAIRKPCLHKQRLWCTDIRFGTISHQGAKGMSKCARGCLPSDSLTVRDLASSGALGRRFACERSIVGVLGCAFVGLDKLA